MVDRSRETGGSGSGEMAMQIIPIPGVVAACLAIVCVCVCVCVWLFVHEGHLINGRNADLYVHCCQDSWLSAGGFAIAI